MRGVLWDECILVLRISCLVDLVLTGKRPGFFRFHALAAVSCEKTSFCRSQYGVRHKQALQFPIITR